MDLNLFAEQSIGNIPLDKGNLLTTAVKLEALRGYNHQIFLLYLAERKYFSNLWTIEGDDALKEAFPQFMKTLVENGKAAIRKGRDKELIVYALTDYSEDFTGFIKKGKGIPAPFRVNKENIQKEKPIDGSDTVFAKVSTEAFPLLFYVWNFIVKLDIYLRSADTNTRTKTKKFKFNVNNNSSVIVAQERASFTNPDTPWVENITSPTGYGVTAEEKGAQANIIDPIMKGSSAEASVWEDISSFEEFWYKRLGKRLNVNFKKERNINAEFENEEEQFLTATNETRIFLERFVRQYNEMHGTNARLVSVAEAMAPKKPVQEGGVDE